MTVRYRETNQGSTMSNSYHDSIVKAFKSISGTEVFSLDKYTHVHGPAHPCKRGAGHCTSHLAIVEKENGTVAPHKDIAVTLGGTPRPQESIRTHPLGHSNGANFGNFGFAFDAATIRRRWDSYDEFARAVVLIAQKCGKW
jgi:hypothetical protein